MPEKLSIHAILTRWALAAAAAALLGSATIAAAAPAPPATLWIFPVIKGYGGVHPRPDLPGVAAGGVYRVIADITQGNKDPTKVARGLQRLARLVNLFAYAGVPRAHVHIAAVIEGPAGFAAFSNAAYRKRFHVDNPNRPLLRELRQAGVKLMVCSQAMAENGIADADVSPNVHITLSALTDFASYGAQGYNYMRL